MKLDTRKLDSLVDLVGELVIAQSMVVQDPDVQRLSSRHLARCLRQLGRITTELQRTAMSLRMVPIRRTFQKMTRLVRDLAAQQQKQVQLVAEGEETELDRNIVEELSDPLVHMIRNSVDHGIESPAVRVSQGKPALGTIRLSASHQRGGIVIEIQDDGKGLDRDRILAKARERGLIKPNATLTEDETLRPHLRARLLHRREGHRCLRPRRGHGRRPAQHREAARQGRNPVRRRPGHHLHHRPAADPRHH